MLPTGNSFDTPGPSTLTDPTTTRITITLQYGSFKEVVVLERTDDQNAFSIFVEKARQLTDRILLQNTVPPPSNTSLTGPSRLPDILLLVHDYQLPTLLKSLTSLIQLDNNAVVEVIRIDHDERPLPQHSTEIKSYRTPTFCDFCGEILMGLMKQGYQCTLCRGNFHERCAGASRNNCPKNEGAPNTYLAGAVDDEASASGTGYQSAKSSTSEMPQHAMPHKWEVHSYTKPTVCKVCDKMLIGLIRQGMRCRDCEVNVHKKCANRFINNCQMSDNAITPNFNRMNMVDGQSMVSSTSEGDTVFSETETMIPLGRIPGPASSRAVRSPGPTAEGWLINFVLTEPTRRFRHYWILADGAISQYNECSDAGSVNPNRCFRQIPLSTILALVPYDGPSVDSNFPPHCFEIHTTSGVIYCVGENLEAFASPPPTKLPRHGSSQATANVAAWFTALQTALQPPPLRTDTANPEPALQFSQLYQILRDKILGSGQFGTVYSSVHRQSGREVAVKVIAKDRFAKKSSAGVETLKSEVAILQNIDHCGIIKLESMFETKDKIFVVMEKMNGDMLEMILSQATGRLDERATKFLILQILAALRYLHSRGIAHCDLKPENVLLSSLEARFPQTKLCDFGYARFIGDAQFRKTIVGTPAYLAPEVLQKKGYNKSLDVWAMGVIIYVSLSGTFPFNDGEEISEQIQNAAFMFPSDGWKDISDTAIDLIQRLLRLNIEERLTIDECMGHVWLQDPVVYVDLRELEIRLNTGRYLTCFENDQKYSAYLQQRGITPYS